VVFAECGVKHMDDDKKWPKVGDKLEHKFRKKSGKVVAEVVSVDKKSGSVSLRVGKEQFPSLTAAAQSLSGFATNGWTYWGLKKQRPTR
jgi:hypothetical protein